MEDYEKLDAILKIYAERGKIEILPDTNHLYFGLPKVSDDEYHKLHQWLISDELLIHIVENESGIESYIAITNEGINFLKEGGYTKVYQQKLGKKRLALEKQELKEQEESEVRKAAIKQGEFAEKAFKTSVVAIIISVVALFKEEFMKFFKYLFSIIQG